VEKRLGDSSAHCTSVLSWRFRCARVRRVPRPVCMGRLTNGDIIRQSPKNISIVPGLYDGPGALSGPGASIEAHLSKIESAAAVAIRKLSATPSADGDVGPPEIWPFLAWQAARTPGREVIDAEEFAAYRKQGWKWVLRRDDHLEMMYLQAWYFQVRFFPRLSWVRLDAPYGEWFITSDRGVAWVVDGLPDTPPAALRHPTAQVVAPLTRKIALVGRHGTHRLQVTPREVNRFVAFAASDWIVGPTRSVVETALIDRERVIKLDRNVGTSSRII
jgi:Protein of unknown function (DUF4238)